MVAAVIVAAGKGIRMQSRLRKQYLPLAGLPILVHTLTAFSKVTASAGFIWLSRRTILTIAAEIF